MKKKLLSLLLAVTMTAVCFAGCSKDEKTDAPLGTAQSNVQSEDNTTVTQADTTIQEEMDGVEAELQAANPTLEDVFQSFQGQYFFDAERGAVIGIEPTAECDYGKEGSTWTVWVTGGDLLSDLDVIDFTSSTIDFKTESGYYQLGHTMAGGVSLDYGTEQGAWTDTIYGN